MTKSRDMIRRVLYLKTHPDISEKNTWKNLKSAGGHIIEIKNL